MSKPILERRIGVWLDPESARKVAHETTSRLVSPHVLSSQSSWRLHGGRAHAKFYFVKATKVEDPRLTAFRDQLRKQGRDLYDPVPKGVIPERLRERLNRRGWVESK